MSGLSRSLPEPEKVATPIAGDDDEAEQPANAASEVEDNDNALEEQDDDDNEGGISDDESILSEVDEAQFEDFNPENVDVEDRPQLAIDEENLKLIGRHKRKRADDGEGRLRRKEGRREKKSRRAHDEDEGEDGASRRRERKKKEASPSTDEETLDPETRRRRALDRAMDEAIRKPGKRRSRKQDGIDLEAMADAEIEDMRKRMTHAAQMDAINRQEGKPAMHKLKLLPEVIMLLNRNQYINSLVDPEINLLEAVRFFLEPLDDGSMPAYNIQRDLLTALTKLPIQKDALIASGIGKVVVFYTKSKRTERRIKDMAEKLLAEWTRPILQRSDDYSKRVFQQADFDPTKIVKRTQTPAEIVAAEARAREKLPPRLANRARVDRTNVTYTIVPRQTAVQESKFARPLGSSGEDRFRKMQARNNAAQKGSRR
ncbi:Transcription factor iws1 [Penicillium daleae]|uniref:Transcription factor iws1 n=1 Tax=Penicillium daleae TaxID=63821 RepID=A0AAD6C4Y9_9EURO|nr:Transcription factor iws1 [Penicillium daleae]KAJ5450109.1 Transcription factor iws1 [Penicillium daleae]